MLPTTKKGNPTPRNKAHNNQANGFVSGDKDWIRFSETPIGNVSAARIIRNKCALTCRAGFTRVERKCA